MSYPSQRINKLNICLSNERGYCLYLSHTSRGRILLLKCNCYRSTVYKANNVDFLNITNSCTFGSNSISPASLYLKIHHGNYFTEENGRERI